LFIAALSRGFFDLQNSVNGSDFSGRSEAAIRGWMRRTPMPPHRVLSVKGAHFRPGSTGKIVTSWAAACALCEGIANCPRRKDAPSPDRQVARRRRRKQIGYLFPIGNRQGYVNLKGYGEFA
jgi:hypothetical protein